MQVEVYKPMNTAIQACYVFALFCFFQSAFAAAAFKVNTATSGLTKVYK